MIKIIENKVLKLAEELNCRIEKIEKNIINNEDKLLLKDNMDWIEIIGSNGYSLLIEENGEIKLYDEHGDFIKFYKSYKSALKNFC